MNIPLWELPYPTETRIQPTLIYVSRDKRISEKTIAPIVKDGGLIVKTVFYNRGGYRAFSYPRQLNHLIVVTVHYYQWYPADNFLETDFGFRADTLEPVSQEEIREAEENYRFMQRLTE